MPPESAQAPPSGGSNLPFSLVCTDPGRRAPGTSDGGTSFSPHGFCWGHSRDPRPPPRTDHRGWNRKEEMRTAGGTAQHRSSHCLPCSLALSQHMLALSPHL